MGWIEIGPRDDAHAPAASLGPYRQQAVPPSGGATLERRWRFTDGVTWVGAAIGALLLHWFCLGPALDEGLWSGPGFGEAVALLFTYVVLVHFVNWTRVTVTEDAIVVKSGPLPSLTPSSNAVLSTRGLRQLYVQQHVKGTDDSRRISYRVIALRDDGAKIVIDEELGDYEHARALERWLEDKLRLTDERVPGEHAPRGARPGR